MRGLPASYVIRRVLRAENSGTRGSHGADTKTVKTTSRQKPENPGCPEELDALCGEEGAASVQTPGQYIKHP